MQFVVFIIEFVYFVLFRFSTYMVNNVDLYDNDYEQKK